MGAQTELVRSMGPLHRGSYALQIVEATVRAPSLPLRPATDPEPRKPIAWFSSTGATRSFLKFVPQRELVPRSAQNRNCAMNIAKSTERPLAF